MSKYRKSLAEIFGQSVSCPPKPVTTQSICPFIEDDCKKKAGIDDFRLRPSGACSIWFDCKFSNPNERPIIICPLRFYTNSYYHLWSLTTKMLPDVDDVILIPEVANIDWVIYSKKEERVMGAIEVQAVDTTGSYKSQLLYLRGINDPSSSQYPQTVNANWANATYKRFYPQVYQTIATMEQFDAPVGLLTQDIFKDYLGSIKRFPRFENDISTNKVVWSFLSIDNVVGTTNNLKETFISFSKESIRDILLQTCHPSSYEVEKAIKEQIDNGKEIRYV